MERDGFGVSGALRAECCHLMAALLLWSREGLPGNPVGIRMINTNSTTAHGQYFVSLCVLELLETVIPFFKQFGRLCYYLKVIIFLLA